MVYKQKQYYLLRYWLGQMQNPSVFYLMHFLHVEIKRKLYDYVFTIYLPNKLIFHQFLNFKISW